MSIVSLFAASTIALATVSMEPARAESFKEGQVWEYRTRPQETDSTLLINKIEADPKLGEVFHITVWALKVRDRQVRSGFISELPHLPVSRTALEASVTRLAGTAPPNLTYRYGYEEWRREVEQGRAGIFTIPVAEIVGFVEATFKK